MLTNEKLAQIGELKGRWAEAIREGNINQANSIMDLIYAWYLSNVSELTTEQYISFRFFFSVNDYL